jgi:hypothetical protein
MNELDSKRLQCESAWHDAEANLIMDGEKDLLIDLLEKKIPIPESTRFVLAEYLRGNIKPPDMRGRKNSKINPADKRWIRQAITSIWQNTEVVLMNIEEIAGDHKKEPIEIRKYIEKIRRDALEAMSKELDIPINTLRQLFSLEEISSWGQVFAGERDLQLPNGKEVSFAELFGRGKTRTELQQSALQEAREYMRHPEVFFDPLRLHPRVTG